MKNGEYPSIQVMVFSRKTLLDIQKGLYDKLIQDCWWGRYVPMTVFLYLRHRHQTRVLFDSGFILNASGVPNSYSAEAVRLNQFERYASTHSVEEAYAMFCDAAAMRLEQFRSCLSEKGKRIALQRYGVAQDCIT